MTSFAPPVVDFGAGLSRLAGEIRDARQRARFEDALAQAGQSGQLDPRAIGLAALASGNPQIGLAAAQLAQADEDRRWRQSTDTRDFGFRQTEAERAQRNAEVQQQLAREQQTLARRTTERQERQPITVQTPGGPQTVEPVIGQDGSVTYRVPQVTGQPPPSNPYSDGGRFTETQGRVAGFSDRMFQSEEVLRRNETQGADATQATLSRVPVVGNYLINAQRQQYEQAQRDFINAQLRRESGAVISPAEFENAQRQYFPQPGDSPETIAQKRRNRQAAIAAMAREGGPNYRPAFAFDANGNMTRRAAERPQQPSVPSAGPPQRPAAAPQRAPQSQGRIVELDGRRYRVNGPGDYEELP